MIGSASFPVCAVECGNPVRTGRLEMKSQMFFSSSTNKIESLCVMLFVLLWKGKVKFGTARVVDCLISPPWARMIVFTDGKPDSMPFRPSGEVLVVEEEPSKMVASFSGGMPTP